MKNMKKISNSGFTLIELLAVIVIMGILMMVAIPSVSRVIENSRKDTFVDIAKSYANSARTLWVADSLTCGNNNTYVSGVDDGDYYILIDTSNSSLATLVDQGGKSSWGNRDVKGYVRVNVSTVSDGKRKQKFYVALTDGTHGVYDDYSNPILADELVRGNVLMNLDSDSEKANAIAVTPFINGHFTTCSEDGGTWTCVVPMKVTFTVGDTTYAAEDGMTWREWVNSEYNIDGSYIEKNYVCSNSLANVVLGYLDSTIDFSNIGLGHCK